MPNNEVPAWKSGLQRTLADQTKRLFLFDLDGTAWGDILSVLSEQFGSVDPDGVKRWRKIEHAYKVAGTMTNGDHLEALFRDLFERHSKEDLLAWLEKHHRLLKNFQRFLAMLKMFNVSPVAFSNGASEFASSMLAHHKIAMPVIANSLAFDKAGKFTGMNFVHDRDEGVRKGVLVQAVREMGYRVIGCAGDSKGDVDMAEETLKGQDGVVIAFGDGILADWCKTNASDQTRWLKITDWTRAESFVSTRLQRL